MSKLTKNLTTPKLSSIKDFHDKKDKIVIQRSTGGLGDILMHRMLFEDIKAMAPDCKVIFACPAKYHDAVYDHPFIDEILDSKEDQAKNYMAFYDTTSVCGRYELRKAPLSDKHRSDIWANHCGVELTNHKMHINLEDKYKLFGTESVAKIATSKPKMVITPVSAFVSKNLLPKQLEELVKLLRNDFSLYGLHSTKIDALEKLGVPTITNTTIRQWMGVIDASDYVLSVDTAAFHYAGGIGKPVVGVFSWADGVVYGKYYNFSLVQMHRKNGNWDCGPCYCWANCPKTKAVPKPCITELTTKMIMKGIEEMVSKYPNAQN